MIKEFIWNNKTSQKQQHPDLIQAGPKIKEERSVSLFHPCLHWLSIKALNMSQSNNSHHMAQLCIAIIMYSCDNQEVPHSTPVWLQHSIWEPPLYMILFFKWVSCRCQAKSGQHSSNPGVACYQQQLLSAIVHPKEGVVLMSSNQEWRNVGPNKTAVWQQWQAPKMLTI